MVLRFGLRREREANSSQHRSDDVSLLDPYNKEVHVRTETCRGR